MKDVRRQLKNYINNANNFQIQSLAASIVNRAAIAIMREIKSSNLQASVCMNVHDELVVEVEDQHLEVVAKIVQKNMENIMPLSLPLKAVPKIATVYGETK
jgi:DNA polymerase-1